MKDRLEAWIRHRRCARLRNLAWLCVAWAAWATMTIRLLRFVQRFTRNIPYADDFAMVPVMTGAEPISLGWAWAQHNEHRPVLSRLIIAGLFRFVANDFRTPRYANAVLLSLMAAAMLVLVRRLRGSYRLTDALLPLAILNFAQAESVMVGFAMNLVLSSVLAIALLLGAGFGSGQRLAVYFGLALVLLPLTGGSGLAMVPPLALWLIGYIAWGWWGRTKPGFAARATGLGLVMACLAITILYFYGYVRPAGYPPPRSLADVASTTLGFLSLATYPSMSGYRWPAGAIIAILVLATLGLLAVSAVRSPGERPCALGIVAVILSIVGVAAAVGLSRAGLSPPARLASRYVTLALPLLCALYVAWVIYGKGRARFAVHVVLLALMCTALPKAHRYSKWYGSTVCVAEQRVEQGLKDHLPTPQLMKLAYPAICSDAENARASFRLLKGARVGAFVNFDDERVAANDHDHDASRR